MKRTWMVNLSCECSLEWKRRRRYLNRQNFFVLQVYRFEIIIPNQPLQLPHQANFPNFISSPVSKCSSYTDGVKNLRLNRCGFTQRKHRLESELALTA